MPLEIGEMDVKTEVYYSENQAGSLDELEPEKEQEIIAACVERIMQILRDKLEL